MGQFASTSTVEKRGTLQTLAESHASTTGVHPCGIFVKDHKQVKHGEFETLDLTTEGNPSSCELEHQPEARF